MKTTIRSYHIKADQKGGLRRAANISLMVNYLFPLGLIIYQVVRTHFETRFLIFGCLFSVCVIALIVYSINRSNKKIDSMKLEITDTDVTFTELGRKDQQIAIASIIAVEPHVKGIELKGKSNSKNAFVVLKEFEKYEEIKKLLEARVAKNKR